MTHDTIQLVKGREYECVYCGIKMVKKGMNLTRDHFKPKSKYGRLPNNLVIACQSCNHIKGSLEFETIEQAREFILARKKEWLEKRTLHRSRKRKAKKLANFGLRTYKQEVAKKKVKFIHDCCFPIYENQSNPL